MTDLERIASLLESAPQEGEHTFASHYEGFRENIVKALLFLLDAMFPTYVKLIFEDSGERNCRMQYLKTDTDTFWPPSA